MTENVPARRWGRPARRLAAAVAGRRAKFVVMGLWLVIAAVAGPLAIQLGSVQNNDSLGALPAGTEAHMAVERARAAFPESDRLVAVVVYAREGGLTAADSAEVAADRDRFAPYAEGELPLTVPSDDGAALVLAFPLAGTPDEQSAAAGRVKRIATEGVPDGLRTALTGTAGADTDIIDAFAGMDLTLVIAAGTAVALLLIVTYRSPVLWLVPLIAVGVANQAASAAVYLLARYGVVTVDLQSQTILSVLIFGVGVDYALLLIARYREELRRHADRHEAMTLAVRRSFPPILASAATVAISLLCLVFAVMPATRGLGPVAAVGIAAALLVMTTLQPALLVLCGRWLFWPFVPGYQGDAGTAAADRGFWACLARAIGRRPRVIWVGSAGVLAVLALGMGNLSVGVAAEDIFTREVGSITGQRLIDAHFPGGTTAPVEVIAAAPSAADVTAAARGVDGVARVGEPLRSADGAWVRVEAVVAGNPDSAAAKDTVERLRDAVHRVPGADAVVGGQIAADIDTDRAATRDNRLVMPLILGVVLVILIVLLRAPLASVLLLASVVLSFLAALGAAGFVLAAIGHTKMYHFIPLQVFLFLVALGVDYSIFLMTRAREEVSQLGARDGVLRALRVTGGVITSAGLVLAATFAMLTLLPLVPSVQTGIIVAMGVLLDTFVVRSLLVPAFAVDAGTRMWWPARPRPATGGAGPHADTAGGIREVVATN